jgi:hypothetical protein
MLIIILANMDSNKLSGVKRMSAPASSFTCTIDNIPQLGTAVDLEPRAGRIAYPVYVYVSATFLSSTLHLFTCVHPQTSRPSIL